MNLITCSYVALIITLLVPFEVNAQQPAKSPESVQARIEADWLGQERLRGRDLGTPQATLDCISRGRRLAESIGSPAGRYREQLVRLNESAAALGDSKDASSWTAPYKKVRTTVREMMLAHPAIDFDRVLFVRRYWPKNAHQCSHRVGEAQRPGAALCILAGLRGDGRVTEIIGDQLAPGGIGRPGLSFDGKRIVFPYAAPRKKPTRYGQGQPGVRGGACLMYDIYQIGIDGKGLRRLTKRPESEDTEPCYLPDGRIAFTSSRKNRYVQCGDWALVFGVHIMNGDGTGQHSITEEQETEFYPSVLEDGRILYTRWDYMMKAFNVIQQLWSVNPDGTKAQLAYGDHFKFSRGPLAFQEVRQVPGTSKVLCIGAAHHNSGVGPLMIVDMAKNRGGPDGMVNLTPEIGYPEAGMSNTNSPRGWFSSPYPLAEDFFLVSSSHSASHAADTFHLYLFDSYGNKELVYRDAKMSCYSPIPIRTRRPPRVIPNTVRDVPPGTPGTMIITDIYQGLDGVARGEVKHLRVLQVHPKTKRTTPQRLDIGNGSGWEIRSVLGTVPVEKDGSAHFHVPSRKMLFFEALDKDYLEIRRMRNYVNVMPGESVSCVGCHEPYGAAAKGAAPGNVLAMQRRPSAIEPPPWGAIGFSYEKIIQPILDRRCTSCHDGTGGEGKSFDLRPGPMVAASGADDHGPKHAVSQSFMNLVKHVKFLRVNGYSCVPTPLPANADVGSLVSPLMKTLGSEHYGLTLPLEERRAFAAWIDCNAPYIGDLDEVQLARASLPESVVPTPKQLQAIKLRRARLGKELAGKKLRLVASLDCGIESRDGVPDGPTLELVRGAAWTCRDKPAAWPSHFSNIWWDGKGVVFRVSRLDPKKSYVLGLAWNDPNENGRVQSVHVRAKGARNEIFPAALLPQGWNARAQTECQTPLPRSLTGTGSIDIIVEREKGSNAVIAEIWIAEKQ